MLNLSSIMLGSAEPKELAEFYQKVLNKKPDMKDDGWYGWQAGGTFLTIGHHSEVSENAMDPKRIILNFETKDVKDEFSRIKDLGARVIKEPYNMSSESQDSWIATFADPDGNYFQLMTPWEE